MVASKNKLNIYSREGRKSAKKYMKDKKRIKPINAGKDKSYTNVSNMNCSKI